MRKSVNDLGYDLWNVINLDTGKRISDVQWANPETGEYCVCVRDKDGEVKFDQEKKEYITEIKVGNIKLVKK